MYFTHGANFGTENKKQTPFLGGGVDGVGGGGF